MDNEIKAIETVYKGYRFRSRLEARWAVFFDACRIEYEYETEGFELPNGERYLPDFYLPEYKWHVEVKPLKRPGADEELKKAIKFIDGSNIKALLILSEIPEPHSQIDLWMYPVIYNHPVCDDLIVRYVMLHPNYVNAIEDYFGAYFITDWIMCKEKYLYRITDDLIGVLKPYPDYKAKYDDDGSYAELSFDGDIIDFEQMKAELARIYNKARQARFEHGETPT